MEPLKSGDFNAPTPVLRADQNGIKKVFSATVNNGTQLLAFDSNNGTASETIATSMKLDTEMSTPMLIADLIYCVQLFSFALTHPICLTLADARSRPRRLCSNFRNS